MTQSKELLTASRMNTMLRCNRQHHWRYEIGLRRSKSADALRFGTAWHTAMEHYAKGASIDDAFAVALATGGVELDAVQAAMLSAMLAGYYRCYAGDDLVAKCHPEIVFDMPIEGSRTFKAAGKIDGLAELRDGRLALIEHKTASDSLAQDSDYWNRLRGNVQLYQYVLAARELGWDVDTIIYDVAHKPAMRPKNIPIVDADGLKVVTVDATGERATNKDGKPRQTAGEGLTMATRTETADEYGDRLLADVLVRPEFYFARREVAILEDDIAEFKAQRLVLSRQILNCRVQATKQKYAEQGWPRNIGEATCRGCEYASFCLQGLRVDVAAPPDGFMVGELHTELSTETTGTEVA